MTARKSTPPSLSELTGKNNSVEENKEETKVASEKDTSTAVASQDSKEVITPPVATSEDVNEGLNDGNEDANEHVVSVKEHKKEKSSSDKTPLEKAVLGRIHKMSPPGMKHLNTYSGGNDVQVHDHEDVVVKPRSETVTKVERVIEDETGKSDLLNKDVVRPTVPSEQAMVRKSTFEHVYATPVDTV